MTSGGSESILLAMKAMRDYGRDKKGITRGEVVACYTVHAGYDKAALILGVKLRKVNNHTSILLYPLFSNHICDCPLADVGMTCKISLSNTDVMVFRNCL